jgi:hypothetical protein
MPRSFFQEPRAGLQSASEVGGGHQWFSALRPHPGTVEILGPGILIEVAMALPAQYQVQAHDHPAACSSVALKALVVTFDDLHEGTRSG